MRQKARSTKDQPREVKKAGRETPKRTPMARRKKISLHARGPEKRQAAVSGQDLRQKTRNQGGWFARTFEFFFRLSMFLCNLLFPGTAAENLMKIPGTVPAANRRTVFFNSLLWHLASSPRRRALIPLKKISVRLGLVCAAVRSRNADKNSNPLCSNITW
jgi:hypothetical protein